MFVQNDVGSLSDNFLSDNGIASIDSSIPQASLERNWSSFSLCFPKSGEKTAKSISLYSLGLPFAHDP